jgi:hypothetical protein
MASAAMPRASLAAGSVGLPRFAPIRVRSPRLPVSLTWAFNLTVTQCGIGVNEETNALIVANVPRYLSNLPLLWSPRSNWRRRLLATPFELKRRLFAFPAAPQASRIALAPPRGRQALRTHALLGGLFGGSKGASSGGSSGGSTASPYYICVDCGWIYDVRVPRGVAGSGCCAQHRAELKETRELGTTPRACLRQHTTAAAATAAATTAAVALHAGPPKVG